MRKSIFQYLLGTSLLVLLLLLLKPAWTPSAATSRGLPHNSVFRLVDSLNNHGLPNYSVKNLNVQELIVQNQRLHFLISDGATLGSAPAFAVTDPDGVLISYVALPKTQWELQMAVSESGDIVVRDFGANTLQIYQPNGRLRSATPAEEQLTNLCAEDAGLRALCPPESATRKQFGTWHPFMLVLYPADDRMIVVDGSSCVLHLGTESGVVGASVPMSDPELERARAETRRLYAAHPGGSSIPAFVIDVEVDAGAVYLLLGAGTQGTEGVVTKYDAKDGHWLNSTVYQNPRIQGAWRTNPDKDWCPLLRFIEIDSETLYLADEIGNVLSFPKG